MDIKELDLAQLTEVELTKLSNAIYKEQDERFEEKDRKRRERDQRLRNLPEWQENEQRIKEYYARRQELTIAANAVEDLPAGDPADPDYEGD